MQEKLDAILEKLNEISERIEQLEESVYEYQNDGAAERNDILCEVQEISQFTEMIYDYQELDFQKFDNENMIFIHSNVFRTHSFVNALVKSYGGLTMTIKMTKTHLTPAALLDIIRKNENILIKSEVFSWSPDFEKIIGDAIVNNEARFVILTNTLENIPQGLREKMRVIQ